MGARVYRDPTSDQATANLTKKTTATKSKSFFITNPGLPVIVIGRREMQAIIGLLNFRKNDRDQIIGTLKKGIK